MLRERETSPTSRVIGRVRTLLGKTNCSLLSLVNTDRQASRFPTNDRLHWSGVDFLAAEDLHEHRICQAKYRGHI